MSDKLTGLIAATHTPFDRQGALDVEVVPRQAAHLAATGVRGVFVAGTTGESLSLTVAEREALAEAWAAAAPAAGLKLIVHVGHTCLADSRRLAAHAQQVGANVVSAMAPCFLRPRDVGALAEWCGQIAAAAPGLPFYYYDIPGMTGVTLPTSQLLQVARNQIPTLVGVKFTNPDLNELQKCLQLDDGHFDILFGCDEALLAGLTLGVRGAVGSTFNFAAPLYRRIIEAFEKDDLETARELQARSVRMVEILQRRTFPPSAKSVMGMLGVDCGPVRPPLTPLADADIAALRRELEQIGFFEWGSPAAPTAGQSRPSAATR